MQTIIPGENRLFHRTLFLENGTDPLLVSSLSYASVQLKQGTTVIATYVKGVGTQLRAGTAANELVLEVTSTITGQLVIDTPLTAMWTLKVADTDFVNEPGLFIDLQVEQLANVEAA